MSNRMMESLSCACVLLPQSVAAATETASSYVDASLADELAFVVDTGALANGKKLTVAVYAATDTDGTGAKKIGEAVFTASAEMDSAQAIVSYRPTDENSRYICVKIKHDAASAVICAVNVLGAVGYLPAAHGWTLVV